MPYISLKELAKKVGQTERTVRSKIAFLKKENLAIYTKYTKRKGKGKVIQYDSEHLVPFFKKASNFEGYKSKKTPEPQTVEDKVEGLDQQTVRRVANILKAPVLTQLTEEQKKIFKLLKTQDEKDRFQICVQICYEYANGTDNIIDVCDNAGVARPTFNVWCRSYICTICIIFKNK